MNEETFIYQPFGTIEVATRIMASMSLQFRKVKTIEPEKTSGVLTTLNKLNKSRSIMFEKPTGIIGSTDADALVAATQSALTKLEPIVEMDGADSFSLLIQLLKMAKKKDILSAFNQIMSGSGYKDTEVPEYVDKIMKIPFKIILKWLNLFCDTLIIFL